MADLIFIDGRHADFERALGDFAEALEDRMSQYTSIMRNAQATAILDADLNMNLDLFIKAYEVVLMKMLRDMKLSALYAERHFDEAGFKDGHLDN